MDNDQLREASERMAADAFAEQDLPLGAPRRGSVPDETWRRCVDIIKGDALQRWEIAARAEAEETRERGRQRILAAARKLSRDEELGIKWVDECLETRRFHYPRRFADMTDKEQELAIDDAKYHMEADR